MLIGYVSLKLHGLLTRLPSRSALSSCHTLPKYAYEVACCRRVELVLLHRPGMEPTGTAAWINPRPLLARHHHARLSNPKVPPVSHMRDPNPLHADTQHIPEQGCTTTRSGIRATQRERWLVRREEEAYKNMVDQVWRSDLLFHCMYLCRTKFIASMCLGWTVTVCGDDVVQL